MKQDLFRYLPLEIIVDVLSRLPVRSVACCKCVCTSWLLLLETDEFAKIHLSRSRPGLLVPDYNMPPNSYAVFDLEGDRLPYQVGKPVTKFNLPSHRMIHGSSDGLLLLRNRYVSPREIYICNPLTRDCVELHYPQELVNSHLSVLYGFGRSKVTGQHKVVGIRQIHLESTEKLCESECEVYTLETGSWRTVAHDQNFWYSVHRPAFVNGNLHWPVYDNSNHISRISCFNLETELFTTFSTPILSHGGCYFEVYGFGNYLCLIADSCSYGIEDEDFIWVMKDYGDENSWTKEFIDFSRRYKLMEALLHTPSFLSLKSFVPEKVCSF